MKKFPTSDEVGNLIFVVWLFSQEKYEPSHRPFEGKLEVLFRVTQEYISPLIISTNEHILVICKISKPPNYDTKWIDCDNITPVKQNLFL